MKRFPPFVLLWSLTLVAFAESTPQIYTATYAYLAVQEMEKSGIPASIKLAQGILESGSGTSYLAVNANNHFGIKCGGNYNGPEAYREDDDRVNGKLIKSCFRVYPSAEESFRAHTRFLQDNRRYAFLFDYKADDYKKWAKGLKKAGYATSPTYPAKLITVIENYDLAKYDKMSSRDLEPLIVVDAGEQRKRDKADRKAEERAREKEARNDKRERPTSRQPTRIAGRKVFSGVTTFNDIRTAYAEEGETLRDIARRTDTDLRKIIDYNAYLKGSRKPLTANTKVYLQPKRSSYRGRQRYHEVQPDESMASISHEYGIKLRKLYKRNRLEEGQQPKAGETLVLKGRKKKGEAPQIRLVSNRRPAGDRPFMDDQDTDEDDARPTTTPRPVPPRPVPPRTTPDRPEQPTTPTTEPPAADPVPDVINVPPTSEALYVVKKGDTLYGIARAHGLRVTELKQLNDLMTNTIRPGQRLRVK